MVLAIIALIEAVATSVIVFRTWRFGRTSRRNYSALHKLYVTEHAELVGWRNVALALYVDGRPLVLGSLGNLRQIHLDNGAESEPYLSVFPPKPQRGVYNALPVYSVLDTAVQQGATLSLTLNHLPDQNDRQPYGIDALLNQIDTGG